MPLRYGIKAPIWLVFAIVLAALSLCPRRAVAFHDSIVDPWPGEPGFEGFVSGHEMDYILDVFWRPKEYTPVGLLDFRSCGDMRIRKDGEIHYTKFGTKHCPDKARYRLVEANPNYIVLFVENLTPPIYMKYRYWVLSHEAASGLEVHRCAYSPLPDEVDYIGPAGFTMSQQDLLDQWNKSVRCNPKLLPPDRGSYWGAPDGVEGYYMIRSNSSPAYDGNRFIYE